VSAVREEAGLSSASVFGQGGGVSLQMRTSVLFDAKNSDNSGYMVCPRGQEGSTLVETRERGQFFPILCRRLLWTAPNIGKPPTEELSVKIYFRF